MESKYKRNAPSVGPNTPSPKLEFSLDVVAVVVQLGSSSRFSKVKQVASYSDPSHSFTAITPVAKSSQDSGKSSVHWTV